MMSLYLALLLTLVTASGATAQALTTDAGSLDWRIEAVFSFADRVEGDRADWRAMSAGVGVELGLREGVSLELEWLPGYTVWSSLDYPDGAGLPDDHATRSAAHDLWAAARIQVIGDSGIARAGRLGLVVAPGLVVPLPEPDWDRQRERALDGKRYVYEAPDRHAIGIGARVDFESFFGRTFGLRGRASYVHFVEKEAESFDAPATQRDTDYAYELRLELEPHWTIDLGRLLWEAGLRATHVIRPETLVDEVVAVDDAFALGAEPWVGVVFAAKRRPLAVSIGYRLPVAERNADTEHGVRLALASASLPGR